tara:strand:+ start:389 stop:589 length:201 start_codon:yes stop_codon:yes gene_type:complete
MFKILDPIKNRIRYQKFKTAYHQAYCVEFLMWESYPDTKEKPVMRLPPYKEIKQILNQKGIIKFEF